MALVPLTLETVGELSGGLAKAIIEREMAVAITDIDDRGEDGKPRKITIEIELVRLNNGQIDTHVKAQAKLPPRQTPSTIAETRRHKEDGARLLFQSMNPERPDQPTFPNLEKNNQ